MPPDAIAVVLDPALTGRRRTAGENGGAGLAPGLTARGCFLALDSALHGNAVSLRAARRSISTVPRV